MTYEMRKATANLIIFRVVQIISLLLGLAPCEINITISSSEDIEYITNFSYSKLGCAYNILLIIIFFVLSVAALPNISRDYDLPYSDFVRIIDVTMSAIGNTFVGIVVLIYCINQKEIVNIANELSEIRSKVSPRLPKKSRMYYYITVVSSFVFIWTVICLIHFIRFKLFLFISFILSAVILSGFLMQYSLIIKLLKDTLEDLNRSFSAMTRVPENLQNISVVPPHVPKTRMIIQHVITIRETRHSLYKIACQVSRFYSFPVLLAIFNCSGNCVNIVYFTIINFIHKPKNSHPLTTTAYVLDGIFLMAVYAYPVVLLTNTVKRFTEEMNKTADIAYDVKQANASNERLISQINDFALELIHKKVSFTAFGFFSLDCTLLHSIFSMTVTYLMILMQFKPPTDANKVNTIKKYGSSIFGKMKSAACNQKISFVLFEIIHTISFLLGLAPCSVKLSPQSAPIIGFTCSFSYSRVKSGYNILIIILFIAIMIVGIPQLNDRRYPNDSLTVKAITLTLAVMGNTIVVLIIILYSIRQRDIIRIGNELHEFDKKYCDRLVGRSANPLEKFRPFITAIFMLFIWIGVLIIEIIRQNDEKYIITSGLNKAFVSWLLIQYSLLIKALQIRFEGLNNAALAPSTYSIAVTEESLLRRRISNDSVIVQNLIMIKRARNQIYKISRRVSGFHSFPALLVIFYCCCCSVDTIYFYIMKLIHSETDRMIEAFFWTLLTLYPIIILSTSINTFQVEANRTAIIIYEIMHRCERSKDIEFELNNFAFELLHRKVSFSACGLFSLDCTLLQSISGMIVTYLLILLQFQPLESQ
ncbi:uncharacterized protein LOC135161838 [Diachasmimorpha longicaudata]|uniref:uncharacterized protein LOC135161838 n=1 Tax=Diachasmimorpha longicaudata TaxID=58733 RepID=UPI0030B8E596